MWRRLIKEMRLKISSQQRDRSENSVGSDLQLQQVYHLASQTTTNENRLSDSVKNLPKHYIATKKSSIPGANQGVFLKGSILQGTVLALYPGIFYPPMPLWTLPSADGWINASQLLKHTGNDYLMHLSGLGGFIDGHPKSTEVLKEILLDSTYSCGNYVNHPPRGKLANVHTISFKWVDVYNSVHDHASEDSLLNFMKRSVPNRFGAGPWFIDHRHATSQGDRVFKVEDLFRNDCLMNLKSLGGVAFVASSDINATKDEIELFLDYNLELKYQPEWYVPPSKQAKP